MADQIRNILSQLKDHEQQPPEFLFDRIYDAAKDEIKRDVLDLQLKELGEYEISPQESHYSAISKSVKGDTNKVRTLFFRLGALAAVLFFFLAAWAIYRMAWMGKGKEVTEMAAINPVQNNPSHPPVAVIQIPGNATDSNTSAGIEKRSYKIVAPKAPNVNPQSPHFSGSNEPLAWVDNDLFYSIINCRYSVLSPYFNDDSRQLIVDVDQYSSTTVSDKMLKFMKTLYRTNRRSKPTFKARRAKRKLEKWKKADASYFDKPANNNNPLDIIDLTRFLAGDKEKDN